MLSLLHLSYNSHSSNRFSALGLALGESWPLLAVYKGLFPREGLLRHTYKNHLRREKGCKLMDQILTVDCKSILLRQPCEELVPWGRNTMALIQTCQIQAIITLPQRLSFSAQHCLPSHKETQMTIIHIQSYSSPCVAKLDKSVRSETRILCAIGPIGAVCLCTADELQCCHMLAR